MMAWMVAVAMKAFAHLVAMKSILLRLSVLGSDGAKPSR